MTIGTRGLLAGSYLGIAGLVTLFAGSIALRRALTTPTARSALLAAGLLLLGTTLVATVIALFDERPVVEELAVPASVELALAAGGAVALTDGLLRVGLAISVVTTLVVAVFFWIEAPLDRSGTGERPR